LVIVGAPKLFSSTTLRPFGPRVTLTALARVFTPLSRRARAFSPKRTSLAAMIFLPQKKLNKNGKRHERAARRSRRRLACALLTFVALNRPSAPSPSPLDHRHDVVFLQEHELFAVDLDFLAGILAEQHRVAFLQRHRANLAVGHDQAGAGGDDLAAGGLLGGAVGDDDAAGGNALFFETLDDDAVMQRTQFAHGRTPMSFEVEQGFQDPDPAILLALVVDECQF